MEEPMAKITRYTKDTLGQQMLSISAIVIIIWLAVAGINVSYPPGEAAAAAQQAGEANGGGAIWYYLAIPVVSMLWGMANYDRAPKSYKSRRTAALMNLLPGSGLGFIVWLFLFASRNPDLLSDLLLGP
jgi:hypothetical protein